MGERIKSSLNEPREVNLELEMFELGGHRSLVDGANLMAKSIEAMPLFDNENLTLGVKDHKLSPKEIVSEIKEYAKGQRLKNYGIPGPNSRLDESVEAATLDLLIQNGVSIEAETRFRSRINELAPIITTNDPEPANIKSLITEVARSGWQSLSQKAVAIGEAGREVSESVRVSAKKIRLDRQVERDKRHDSKEGKKSSLNFVQELSDSMPVFDSVYRDGGIEHPRTEFHASIKNLVAKGWFTEIQFSDWKAAVLSRPENPVVTDIKLKSGQTVHLDSSALEGSLPKSKDQMVPFESAFYAICKSEARLRSAIKVSDAAYRVSYEHEADKGVNAASVVGFEKLKLTALRDIRQAMIDGEISKAKPGLNLTLRDLEKHTENYLTAKGVTQGALSATLILAFVLSSCAPVTSPSINNDPTQSPIVLVSPTPDSVETPVAIASPTLAPAVDLGDVNGEEFSFDSLDPFSTYVVITDNGLSQASFGLPIEQLSAEQQADLSVLELSMVGQLADAIQKNPGYESYYIPAFISVDDLKNSLGDEADSFNLVAFRDLSGSTKYDDGLLMSVHLGAGGWDVIGWEDFRMRQINGVYYVDGLMRLGINEDSDPAYERYDLVRGQRLGNNVLGAFPVITEAGRFVVKVDVNGTVIEIMSNDGFASGADNPWQLPEDIGEGVLREALLDAGVEFDADGVKTTNVFLDENGKERFVVRYSNDILPGKTDSSGDKEYWVDYIQYPQEVLEYMCYNMWGGIMQMQMNNTSYLQSEFRGVESATSSQTMEDIRLIREKAEAVLAKHDTIPLVFYDNEMAGEKHLADIASIELNYLSKDEFLILKESFEAKGIEHSSLPGWVNHPKKDSAVVAGNDNIDPEAAPTYDNNMMVLFQGDKMIMYMYDWGDLADRGPNGKTDNQGYTIFELIPISRENEYVHMSLVQLYTDSVLLAKYASVSEGELYTRWNQLTYSYFDPLIVYGSDGDNAAEAAQILDRTPQD